MAFRFRRTLGLLPGLRLNLGKKSASFSIGVRGLRHTIGTRGTRSTVGLPGSGLSYTTASPAPAQEPGGRSYGRWIAAALVLAGLIWLVARSPAPPAPIQPRPAAAAAPAPPPEAQRAQPSTPRPPVAAPARPVPTPDPWAKAR